MCILMAVVGLVLATFYASVLFVLHWCSFITSYSAGQEIFHHISNPDVHYSFHKSVPLDPILNHMNAVRIITPYCFKIHFNGIVPFMTRSPKCSFSSVCSF
jgi:hypothetical protein